MSRPPPDFSMHTTTTEGSTSRQGGRDGSNGGGLPPLHMRSYRSSSDLGTSSSSWRGIGGGGGEPSQQPQQGTNLTGSTTNNNHNTTTTNMNHSSDDPANATMVHNIASFLTLSDAASNTNTPTLGLATTSNHSSMDLLLQQQQQQQRTTTTTTTTTTIPHVGSSSEIVTPADSWMVGVPYHNSQNPHAQSHGHSHDDDTTNNPWSLATPPTPGLVAISPGATPGYAMEIPTTIVPTHQVVGSGGGHERIVSSTYGCHSPQPDGTDDDDDDITDSDNDDSSGYYQQMLQERRRKWAQEKLASAVFAHPQSVRSFCLEAYSAAQDIRTKQQKEYYKKQQELQQQQQQMVVVVEDPETLVEPALHPPLPQAQPVVMVPTMSRKKKKKSRKERRMLFLNELINVLFNNVPLSVFMDVVDNLTGVSLDTSYAGARLTIQTIDGTISAVVYSIRVVWDAVTNFNPFHVLDAIVSLQFNAMSKTSDVLVSGIQSVATGVGSASSIAFRLSTANLSLSGMNVPGSSSSLTGGGAIRRNKACNKYNEKLIKKMSSINDAARVVSYLESGDDTGGLTKQAISRTRKMLHYSVSLRPFVATVKVKVNDSPPSQAPNEASANVSDGSDEDGSPSTFASADSGTGNSSGNKSNTPNSSPLIYSPQSFPPSPKARQRVLARGSQWTDNVIFWARDKLRIQMAKESEDDRTREMAHALYERDRCAVFDATAANGIELTCGQHIATKIGNMHYASTRSFVPLLRNCYVYFEITVMPRIPNDLAVHAAPAILSIGLSTVEMPLNTLVGSWQGSVGLCTSGQIFVAGQWCSLADPSLSSYGYGTTVGCLVFLDDSSAFETWDGVMVNSSVMFNINGNLVPPPVNSLKLAAEQSPTVLGASPTSPATTSGSATLYTGVGYADPMSSLARGPASKATFTTPSLLVPAAEDLYPTVTLQSPATGVMCRFSSEDITAQSRAEIGAPNGVTVYAVDGSVIFADEQTVPDSIQISHDS